MDKFCNRLEILIKENKTKKRDLADAINKSPQAITEMVKDRMNPSLDTIRAIARYYGVSEEWLEHGSGQKIMEESPGYVPSVFYEKLDPAELEVLKLLRDSPEIQTIVKALGVSKEVQQDALDAVEALVKLPKNQRKKHLGKMFEDLEKK